jgi:hypothetical protein
MPPYRRDDDRRWQQHYGYDNEAGDLTATYSNTHEQVTAPQAKLDAPGAPTNPDAAH